MSEDDLCGGQIPIGIERTGQDAGAIVKRFEGAFDQALEARRFDRCNELLSEISTLTEKLSDIYRARIELQRARLDFHQDRLPNVEEVCQHLLGRFATQVTHTREEIELLGDVWALHGAWARRVGQIDLAIASYGESRSKYEMIGLTPKMARIDHRLGLVYRLTGMWRQAIDHYESSLHILESGGEPGEFATALNDLGNVYRLSGKLDKALTLCQQSLHIREKSNNNHALGLSYNTLGMIHREMGQLEEATVFQQRAVDLFLETRDKLGEARARNNLGYIYYREGNFEEALRELAASLFLLESLPDKGGSFLANTLDKLGRVRRDQGMYEEAMDLFKKDLEIAMAFQDYYQQAEARYELSVLYRKTGNWELMQAESLQTRQLAGKYEYPYFAGRTWEIQGDVNLDQEMYEEAFVDYRNALGEILKYTAKRYEELASRIANHFKAIPDSQVQIKVRDAMISWASNYQVEDRENQIGSEIHIISLISNPQLKYDKEESA